MSCGVLLALAVSSFGDNPGISPRAQSSGPTAAATVIETGIASYYGAKYHERFPSLYVGAKVAGGFIPIHARRKLGKARYPKVVKSVGTAPPQYPDPDEEFEDE